MSPDPRDPWRDFREMDERLSWLPRGASHPDARVRHAVGEIVAGRGEVVMPDVARSAHIGLRQLQRLFLAATGLTLREYARIRRLREALAQRLAPGPGGWSRIAAETGYVDHSHLTREFVALTGLSPTQAARHLARITHVDVRP